jgi:hypothetical protein
VVPAPVPHASITRSRDRPSRRPSGPRAAPRFGSIDRNWLPGNAWQRPRRALDRPTRRRRPHGDRWQRPRRLGQRRSNAALTEPARASYRCRLPLVRAQGRAARCPGQAQGVRSVSAAPCEATMPADASDPQEATAPTLAGRRRHRRRDGLYSGVGNSRQFSRRRPVLPVKLPWIDFRSPVSLPPMSRAWPSTLKKRRSVTTLVVAVE